MARDSVGGTSGGSARRSVASGGKRLSLATVSATRKLWSGNIAVAEGALAAGVDFYAGYPITPSSAIMEHLARELPKRGGTFLQAEDEIASVFMLIGASWAGGRPLTATSGPGFSLMQEGLGIAIMTETPLVVVDVMRLGPGTGQASKAGQGDLMQARWGRHGDQHLVVYAPTSAQDCFDLAVRAVNTAEKLRVPVVLLSDELVAHTWEGVAVPETVERVERPRYTGEGLPFASPDPRVTPPMPALGEGHGVLMTGSTHDGRGVRFTADPDVHRALATRLVDKVRLNADELAVIEEHGTDDAEVGVVAYGSVARAALAARELVAAQGIRLGVVVPKTLWPLPEEPIRRLAERVRAIVVPELSLGQLVLDVERIAAGACPVIGLSKVGGGIPLFPSEIAARVREVMP
ncbi:MAG: 2-oxoglutarate/2-oxoacid ferredoxin oxidoreductase, alpha subunit [Candidatus Bipolaricaulis sibiricus]|uniref:2-oxoglutarate/2-oxoacid ferredoxin oxidoreductase, alpha subunit n=1 Tax=Bipolaricaulis sibiricus TaxID=2501609 RepID=A0A410FVB2_BIPS1|nr:MAG: 2-oxoglutarate/2-oxoacid ferredoxin oxidoreductase, alpha subunit [Candidatus Bipolaricaulis sibiricus]